MKKFIAYFWILLSYLCFSADCAEKSLAYDPNGNVSRYTAPHAGEISYAYDPIKRLTNIDYPDGKSVKYAYDYNSNLTEISDDHGITSYSYDALNRLIKSSTPQFRKLIKNSDHILHSIFQLSKLILNIEIVISKNNVI